MKEKRKLNKEHCYGTYDDLIGCVCLYEDSLSRKWIHVLIYGAYDVEGIGRLYAILMENETGKFSAMSGVPSARLFPLHPNHFETKVAYFRLLAGIIDQEHENWRKAL